MIIGIVIIGRNEGQRLQRCLASVSGHAGPVVYVDSGSTDGSVAYAADSGAEVVSLDLSTPFTAARARNAGFSRLLALRPDADAVQTVDGDCEVAPGWLAAASAVLAAEPRLAIVFGRRRERFPEASAYNLMCDLEWQIPPGSADSCGGDALIRLSAFQAVGGYNESMIAGEEPEMCFRLRQEGWRIRCIDHPMTWHDAAMTRFGQFFKRTVRAGHAYAENAFLHRRAAARHQWRNVLSSLFWGVGLPLLVLLTLWPSRGLSLLLLAAYGVLYRRIYRYRIRLGNSRREAALYAFFTLLAKFIEPLGMAKFIVDRLVLKKRASLIEYKQADG